MSENTVENKTMKIALYAGKYNSESVNEFDDWIEKHNEYVRITEVLEVTFVPRDHDVILQARVACLDREIKNVQADAEHKVNDLKDQKQRLMAIEDKRG